MDLVLGSDALQNLIGPKGFVLSTEMNSRNSWRIHVEKIYLFSKKLYLYLFFYNYIILIFMHNMKILRNWLIFLVILVALIILDSSGMI